MKCVLFPGQQEALAQRAAELRAEKRRAMTRRTALGLGLGGVFGVTTGSLATLGVTAHARADGTPVAGRCPNARTTAELDWARVLAVGRLDDLLDAQVAYANAIAEAEEIDELLWVGAIRLANAVVDEHHAARPDLGRMLLAAARERDVPAGLLPMLRLAGAR